MLLDVGVRLVYEQECIHQVKEQAFVKAETRSVVRECTRRMCSELLVVYEVKINLPDNIADAYVGQ